jgi:hypothetical protein
MRPVPTVASSSLGPSIYRGRVGALLGSLSANYRQGRHQPVCIDAIITRTKNSDLQEGRCLPRHSPHPRCRNLATKHRLPVGRQFR